MKHESPFKLTGLLAEIAAAAGVDAPHALAREKGGRLVYFQRRPKPDNWLCELVGHRKALAIAAAVLPGKGGQPLAVPMGPTTEQAIRQRRIRQMLSGGHSLSAVARAVGCDVSTVKRHRRKLRMEAGRP